jgi:2,3-bisphosphoglycerate-dependent phosphoglycerate mutase
MPHPVYLVRHGQSEWNVLRLTQGQTPHPTLTTLGREQAEVAADLIAADLAVRDASVARIITSDLARAVETAEIIAERLGGTVSHDPRLREQGLGALEGQGYEESWAAADSFDWSDPTLPIAGGESLMEVYARTAAVLDAVHPDGSVVLVSHGGPIRAAVSYLKGVKPHESDWVGVPNGSVARIDHQGIAWLGQ